MRILIHLACALVCAFATTALADTTLVYNADTDPLKVRVQPGAVRIDGAGPHWQLYRKAENTIYSVDPKTNTYVRMDADTAKAIRKQMQALRAQMEKKLAELPPEKRRVARAALAEQMPVFSDKPQAQSIEKTDNVRQIAGRQCQTVVIKRGDKRSGTVCVAERTVLGMSKAEFATVKAMFALMNTMLAGTGLKYIGLPYAELDGMPLRYSRGKGTAQRTLSRVSHNDLPAMVFKIPPSYDETRPHLND